MGSSSVTVGYLYGRVTRRRTAGCLSFYTEFGLTHMKTRENTIPKKHLFIGGKLAAQTLPPLYPDTAQETIGRTGETSGKDRAAKYFSPAGMETEEPGRQRRV